MKSQKTSLVLLSLILFALLGYALFTLSLLQEKSKKASLPSTSSAPSLLETKKQDTTIAIPHYLHFEPKKAQVYWVKCWNTPDFTLKREWTGIAWDGQCFLGVKKGENVYYLFTRDSLPIERIFPAKGVTTDVRKTCWWIKYVTFLVAGEKIDVILDKKDASLKDFVREASVVRNNQELDWVVQDLIAKISKSPGKTPEEKIIAFTAQTIKGKPSSWDAWKNPGYYSE